ncbi:MAG: hypothetical protein O3B01_00665 [Planctomycetota bacterium]|nr:hypothetical protein [Planctomycetota bacterium]MDA1137066.1 hypothetical protein [Planctomycetota bacterium]
MSPKNDNQDEKSGGGSSVLPTVILSSLLVALSLHFLGGALRQNIALIRFPFSIEHNEGAVLQLSYDLARGKAIYRPLNEPPYVPGDYPPFFLTLNAVAIKIFGLNLWSGRLLSFVGVIAIAVMVGIWSFRTTRSKLWGACAGLSIFLSPLFYNLCSFYRVDVLAVALSFGGFFVLVHLNSEKGDWAAVVCFLLSLYTKHSMIAGPAAAFLFLFREDRVRAKNLLIRLVSSGGALFLLFTIKTRQEFFRHLVLYHAMSYDWGSFLRHLIEFGKGSAPFLICTATLVIKFKVERAAPVLIYAATSLLHVLLLTRSGASMHYLLEPAIASILATTVGLPLLWNQKKSGLSPASALGLAAVLACQFIFVQIIPAKPQFSPDKVMSDLASLRHHEAALYEFIKGKGDILAEDQCYALLSGRDSVVSPFHVAQLSREGRFDQTKFLESIGKDEYPVLILNSSPSDPKHGTRLSFSDEVLEAMAKNYRPAQGAWKHRMVYLWRGE